MATEKLDTADINTCFVEKQDLISNTDAQSIDKVVIPDKVENLKPVKMETFYHTVEAADPEASSIKHSDSELKSQENDQLQNLGPYPSPQSQNLMPYPSPQSQNLVPFHPVAQSQNFVSYPIAQSQNFVSYPIAQLQNLVSYSIAQSQIINPLYVTRERGDVPVSEKGDEFPCKNQGMYVDNGTVYKKKLPCDSRLVTSGLRCEKG